MPRRAARERARQAAGPSFDLKAWHRVALDAGPMGLATFEEAMAGT